MSMLTRLGLRGPPAWDSATNREALGSGVVASIVLVTWNRFRMLEKCVASLLENTSGVAYELIVWDNASDDGTAGYLDDVAARCPQVRVVHSGVNIGLNAVAAGIRLARGIYIIELDDDVLDFPAGWLGDMIAAFDAVPRAGYLAADVVQNEVTNGAKPGLETYRERRYRSGTIVQHGPTGGWCTMTSRAVISRIGNFMEAPDRTFFSEDGEFASRCRRNLYRVGVIPSVRVYHATGVAANAEFGYLEQCRAKYADGGEYAALLDGTIGTMDQGSREG